MQSPSNTQQAEAISFEIEIGRSQASPPVKQRLELAAQLTREQLTLQQIQAKLDRANERKTLQIQNVVEQRRENSDRIGLTQERKSSIERAQGEQRIRVIEHKLTTATANHQRQLTSIQEKARRHNERALLVRERKTSQERAEEERASNEISQKLESAEER